MSSVVLIEITPPGGGADDITDSVIFASASFQSQLSAIPGMCEFTVRDTAQVHGFVTGSEISLTIDGIKMWGGWLLEISATFAFEADDTSSPGTFQNRYWLLRGVDYNLLFDKRVLRNTANYRASPPRVTGSTMDGAALTYMLENYVDVPGTFDTATFMDDITTVSSNPTKTWAYVQQGTLIREQFNQLSLRSAAAYYIDADRNFHYHSIENEESAWGFSDVPNNAAISAPTGFQDAYYGFREVEATEDGSGLVNDALIWGGSEWTGDGAVVFARTEDATSQAAHGRWQQGEVHIGEEGFGIQEGVNARANAIVLGPPGADAYGQEKGLRYSQWQFRCAWHDKDVPLLTGNKIHLRAGQLVTLDLQVFGIARVLPLRSLTITFPEGDPTNLNAYVRFDGDFGIQLSDPFTLWKAILQSQKQVTRTVTTVVNTVTSGSTQVVYGAQGQFLASPLPNGVETVFTIPFGYLPNTTQVYYDDGSGGVLRRRGIDYTESDTAAGEITFVDPPGGGEIWVICRTLEQ